LKAKAPVLVFKLHSPNALCWRAGVDNKHHCSIFMKPSASANTSADMFSGGKEFHQELITWQAVPVAKHTYLPE
jgi:hypothetical protein